MDLATITIIIISAAGTIIGSTTFLVVSLIKSNIQMRFDALEKSNFERSLAIEKSFKRIDGHITDHSGELRVINDKIQVVENRITKVEARCDLLNVCRAEGHHG